MRWNIVKNAWAMASEEFRGHKVFVPCPLSVSQEGEMPVYSIDDGKPTKVATMTYRVVPRGSGAVVLLRLGDAGREVQLPSHGRALAIKSSRTEVPAATLVKEAKHVGKRKFKDYERVRVMDPLSMEYQEIGQILMSKRTKGGRAYLILVDGSSKPIWVREDNVAENMAGAAPNG
jgi:hypothetical protein